MAAWRWESMELMICPSCGISYGVPKQFIEARRNWPHSEKAPSWFCPNGHSLSYDETELDRVRRERDRLTQQAARLEDERRAADRRVTEEQARTREERQKRERVEKRVGAGVCPCCNRTVAQLARHMQAKHPDVPFVPVAKKVARVRPARADG